jgi:hypothetical protein
VDDQRLIQRLGDGMGGPNPDLGTHMNEIDGSCSPGVFLGTNAAASAAFLQSEMFCHVPVFVTTGGPPGNKTIK